MNEILHQWTYRDMLLVTPLPADLTPAQVEQELANRREAIDAQQDMAELIGEEV